MRTDTRWLTHQDRGRSQCSIVALLLSLLCFRSALHNCSVLDWKRTTHLHIKCVLILNVLLLPDHFFFPLCLFGENSHTKRLSGFSVKHQTQNRNSFILKNLLCIPLHFACDRCDPILSRENVMSCRYCITRIGKTDKYIPDVVCKIRLFRGFWFPCSCVCSHLFLWYCCPFFVIVVSFSPDLWNLQALKTDFECIHYSVQLQ